METQGGVKMTLRVTIFSLGLLGLTFDNSAGSLLYVDGTEIVLGLKGGLNPLAY